MGDLLIVTKEYICPDCGIKGLDINSSCLRCRARLYRRKYSLKRKKERIEKGLCPNCAKPAAQGKKFCPSCLVKRNLNERLRKEHVAADGTCPRCGINPVKPDTTYCKECTEKARIMAYEYRIRKDYKDPGPSGEREG